MDVVDIAQTFTEQRLTKTLSSRKTLTLPFSGFCLACSDPVEARRFCDSTCRCNYEAALRRRMIHPASH